MSDGRIRITISVECDSETLAQALETLFKQIAVRELPKPESKAPFSRPTEFPVRVHPFPRRRP